MINDDTELESENTMLSKINNTQKEITMMQHQLYLLDIEKFDIKFQIYYWLYSPNPVLPLDNIVKQCLSVNIPITIIVYKTVQHMLFDNKDFTHIKTFLINHHFDITDEQLHNIIAFCKQPHLTKYFNKTIMSQLYKKAINPPVLDAPSHLDYPIPDPYEGRPKISWKVCAYARCNQQFHTEEQLIQHLKSYNKYIPYMHAEHENTVDRLNLTPSTIISKKLTRCPSPICSDNNKIFTPDSLCEHFKILGIEPFWKIGTIIKPTEVYSSTFLKTIHTSEDCVICINNQPEAITYPCLHHIYCLDCVTKIKSCSVCRSPINTFLPF